jgi:gamma-glutamylcyclotransferase (GGCT)/AIG2-like uncharacterized protein YtfP
MIRPVTDYVFGYGSLVAPLGLDLARARRREGFVADLPGFRRVWGVAMDNRRDLPGYKCYVDADGRRPAVFVCFLDLAEDPGERVNGVCLPVDAGGLAALDRRERNYDRVEVTSQIGGADRVWAYIGSPAGRARLRQGRGAGTAVIHDGYLAQVTAAFQALGEDEWAACARSLDPGGLPVVALSRRELS